MSGVQPTTEPPGVAPSSTQDVDDEAFLRAFESCRLAAESFRHRDHVRLAWILLRRQPLAEVLQRVGQGLRRFADHHGIDGLYNETVTWTYLMAVHQKLRHDGEARESPELDPSFDAFCEGNADLLEPVPRFMERWYRSETWRSQAAKDAYVLPDRYEK